MLHSRLFSSAAPPKVDKSPNDHKIAEGDSLKFKIPFTSDTPVRARLLRNGREVPENDRIRLQPFDDYLSFALKGGTSPIIRSKSLKDDSPRGLRSL